MGFFSSLDSESYDREYSDRQLLLRIGEYFKVHRRKLIWVVVDLLIIAGAAASLPLIVSWSVNILESAPSPMLISIIVGSVLAGGVIVWLVNWVRRRLLARIVADIVQQMRIDAFSAVTEHDLSFYDKFSSGRIVSRITSDSREFGQLVILVTDIISQIFQVFILGAVIISINLRLTLYLLTFIPFLFLASNLFRRLARNVTRMGMRAMANVNAAIKETISGIAIAKNFRQEMTIFNDFNEANQQSYKVNVRRGFVLSMIFPALNAMNGIATAVIVYAGGLSAVEGIVTFGAWFLFIMSLDRFFFPVLNLSAFWANIQSGLSASERIFALIDAENKVVQISNHLSPDLIGSIQFIGVNFRYTKQETIFEDFNLEISPGESVALVGHTGAGKSSIAKLIARMYEFQEGQILIDGMDIRSLDLISYRKSLGIVPQSPFLFSGTIYENICYGVGDQTFGEIEELASSIGNGDWLETLTKGLYTEVGERGSRISMGQRQMVALLRVIVHKPAIFILDEATASIDPFTELQIQQALSTVLSSTTSILIAHRLSTIKAADKILVLDKGSIIEQGTHDGLLDLDGEYAKLYNTYFRHQSLEYAEKIHSQLNSSTARLSDE